jgi:hypothetical protein
LKSRLFFNVWQCHGKWVEKHFLMFGYVIKNKLKNNFFSSLLKEFEPRLTNKKVKGVWNQEQSNCINYFK